MGLGRSWLLLALVGGCYAPTPSEGAPCTTDSECPRSLRCFANRCLAEPPDVAPDASGDAAAIDAPRSVCADHLQCDDFESGDLSAWGTHLTLAEATVAVGSERAHSGVRAVEAFVPPQTFTGSQAYLKRSSAPQATGMLAARAWINAANPITNFSAVMIFVGDDRYVSISGNNLGRWTATEQSSAGLFDHASTKPTEQDRWICVELDYVLTTRELRLYIDTELVLDVDVNDPAPAFSDVGTGVTRAPLAGFRVFVDDVIVSNKHIGCE